MSPITLLGRDDAIYTWRKRVPGAFGGYALQAPGRSV
jgi:hypothetical protein